MRILPCLALAMPACVALSVTPSHISREVAGKGRANLDRSARSVPRRVFIQSIPSVAAIVFSIFGGKANHAVASDFTPGGTLVDRQVGIKVGNAEASPSRKTDNSNVLFSQDYYFKFGTAAPWLEPDSTEFPKTMPFTRIQQRYDALKKYKTRILSGLDRIESLENAGSLDEFADPTAADVYSLRPMGLLANAMLASENSGATNELFLARWYINEIYLLLNDVRMVATLEQAKAFTSTVRKATNSYLTLMNRVITDKVGEKFDYL